MYIIKVSLSKEKRQEHSTILCNCVPSYTCYLAPDSFKLELSKINLNWSRTKFLSHRTAWSYFLKLAYIRTE